jgi:hypothetical protein
MRTDGVFTLGHHRVENWSVNRPLRLIPFGDVHRDSPSHSAECWGRFKEYGKSLKDTLFLGMGDYLDSYSTSERSIIYHEAIHESTRKREEEESRGRISALAAELSWMRGKCIGIMSGNHFVRFADGTTGDMKLAESLNTRFLGVCTAFRLSFGFSNHGTATVSIDIFAHHGKGGGTTAGGRFNAVEKLANICEADIFLMGDNHARGVFPLGDKLRLESNQRGAYLRSRHAWIGRTGSFLKAYEPGESNYVVDRALTPSNLGWIEFTLTPRRIKCQGSDRMTVEIGAIQ